MPIFFEEHAVFPRSALRSCNVILALVSSANVSSVISVSTKMKLQCALIIQYIISNSLHVKWTYSVYMFTLLGGSLLCFSAGSRSDKITFTKEYIFFLMSIWKACRLHSNFFLSFLSLSPTFLPHILDLYLILLDCFLFSSSSACLFQNKLFFFF